VNATESKEKLIAGNLRYMNSAPAAKDLGRERRRELAENGQKPFALIVCCSDSRVPPEIVFDQGLGELFIVRTAGNVLDDAGMGSVEYGAEHLGIPLVVVLGHGSCGAVKATVDGPDASGCLGSIVEKIRVSLGRVRGEADIYAACEDENIKNTAAEIRGNPVVRHCIEHGGLEVHCAKYDVRSGKVSFFN
jgi:carbonic anhydrase